MEKALRQISNALLALALLCAAASGSISTTNPTSGAVARWDLSEHPGGAVPYFINPVQPAGAIQISPPGTTVEDLVSIVRSAFQLWQDIPTSTIRYAYQGTTTRSSALDGVNVVTFAPTSAVVGASGLTLMATAVAAGPVRMPDDSIIVAKFAGQILDADIVINPQTTFSISEGILPSSVVPLEGTVTHEVGHLSGLSHSAVAGAVMYGYSNLGRGRINRGPREDDILGISALYPTPELMETTGEITGTVSSTTGMPIFGAQITVLDAASGAIVGATLTGVATTTADGAPSTYSRNSGKYVVRGLRPGSYSVVAEPLDGPGSPVIGGIFASSSSGVEFINATFVPSSIRGPLTLGAGTSVSLDIVVNAKSAMSPNLGASPFASPVGQTPVSPAEIEIGTTQTVSIGSNENILSGNSLAAGFSFNVSGSGVTTGSASASSNFLRLPVTVSEDAATAPRLLTVNTSEGTSLLSGGLIVIPPPINFAQFANGAGTASTTVVLNPASAATAVGKLVLRGADGNSAKTGFVLAPGQEITPADQESVRKTSFDFVVAPLGSAKIQSDGLGGIVTGSATLRSTQPVGGIIKFAIQGIGVAGVERSLPVSGFITPARRTGSINTGIAIANATSQEFQISLGIRNRSGAVVAANVSRTLPANGHLAAYITELFPAVDLNDFEGTLIVTTGNSARLITGTALEIGASPGEFTTLPVTEIQDQPGERILRFAQFANGAGIRSDVVVTNASTVATLNGRVEFFDDAGAALATGVQGSGQVSRIDFNIAPLSSRTFSSDGQGALVTGWARVTSDRASGGVVRFSLPGLGIAGVGVSEPIENGFMVPITTNVNTGLDTGIALINAGDIPVDVQMVLRNAAGVIVAGGIYDIAGLAPRAHLARMARQLFPNAQFGIFEGTLSVVVKTAGGRVSGTALELGSAPGQFTTLPVVPLR